MQRLAPLLLVLPALVAAGCGGDEETGAAPKPPELTVPQTSTAEETRTTETTTEPAAPAPGPPNGHRPEAPATQPRQDSPENDTPPPAGSPAERFEKFCDENPGACG